jgi:hypothetical protein
VFGLVDGNPTPVIFRESVGRPDFQEEIPKDHWASGFPRPSARAANGS